MYCTHTILYIWTFIYMYVKHRKKLYNFFRLNIEHQTYTKLGHTRFYFGFSVDRTRFLLCCAFVRAHIDENSSSVVVFRFQFMRPDRADHPEISRNSMRNLCALFVRINNNYYYSLRLPIYPGTLMTNDCVCKINGAHSHTIMGNDVL